VSPYGPLPTQKRGGVAGDNVCSLCHALWRWNVGKYNESSRLHGFIALKSRTKLHLWVAVIINCLKSSFSCSAPKNRQQSGMSMSVFISCVDIPLPNWVCSTQFFKHTHTHTHVYTHIHIHARHTKKREERRDTLSSAQRIRCVLDPSSPFSHSRKVETAPRWTDNPLFLCSLLSPPKP